MFHRDLISGAVTSKELTVDYCDTFQDLDHVRESFPNVTVDVAEGTLAPPFTLQLTLTAVNAVPQITAVKVSPSVRSPTSPYEDLFEVSSLRQAVRYTPKQVEAITTGMQDKVTMIVGPPGTGKTDVAVQIIANLYQQHPTQKILVVTHSNAALNDIFAKIMAKVDVDPRHLLRLGSGERDLRENIVARTMQQKAERLREQLELENTFSKTGRVNWSLTRRLHLLTQVQQLAISLGVFGDFGSSCEVAEYFYQSQIKPRIDQVEKAAATSADGIDVESFLFRPFFHDLPVESWTKPNIIVRCLRTVEKIFTELRDYRAYELLRTQTLRGDYLLTKQVRDRNVINQWVIRKQPYGFEQWWRE